MNTYSLKQKDIKKKWYLINAEGLVLGRLASKISMILRGKHKTTFTPHLDCGDNVVVINAKKVRLTGSKEKKKVYYKHTGYGTIKDVAIKILRPNIKKVFNDEKHTLEAQKPELMDFASQNRKNKV